MAGKQKINVESIGPYKYTRLSKSISTTLEWLIPDSLNNNKDIFILFFKKSLKINL